MQSWNWGLGLWLNLLLIIRPLRFSLYGIPALQRNGEGVHACFGELWQASPPLQDVGTAVGSQCFLDPTKELLQTAGI